MAFVFPSAEWADQFKETINDSAAYASSAKKGEGDFYFTVEASGSMKTPAKLYVDLWHGKCREAYMVIDEGGKEPEFLISGPITTYRKIFEKKLDPIQALMSRQLKLNGNMGKVMREVKVTLDLVNCAAAVGATYADEVG